MKVLVDTSIWSLALRRREQAQNPETEELARLIASHVVEIIGPIRQEILSGVRDGAQFDRLERHLDAFVDQPLTVEDYVTAARCTTYVAPKEFRANTEFLICAVAVRHDFSIFTTDQDFLHFAKCLPIVLHDARLTRSAPAHYRRSDPKREA